MHRSTRTLGSILLTAAFIIPSSLSAISAFQDRRDERKEERKEEKREEKRERYYDKKHRDYHDWDDRERTSFQIYLTERHMPVIEFRLMKDRDQQRYWEWRHKHEHEDHGRH